MKKNKAIKTFYTLIAIFILLLAYFIIPFPEPIKRTSFLFVAVLGLVFLILGITLIVLAAKSKLEKKLKIFLILTGASAACVLPAAVLHNLVYALFIILFGEGFWANGDEAFFFILALIICPIIFLIGTIGSMVITIPSKGASNEYSSRIRATCRLAASSKGAENVRQS